MIRRPPISTLFLYTTLFRSLVHTELEHVVDEGDEAQPPTVVLVHRDSVDMAQHLFDVRRDGSRSEEHTSELQSRQYLVCRLLFEKKYYYQSVTSTPGGLLLS